ncbi:MAG: hypothetical protein H3Z52_13530, partial [archaeon]|nr:hypothetical protein [archaeon]
LEIGYIDKKEHSMIDKIRRIRNPYAHIKDVRTLMDSQIHWLPIDDQLRLDTMSPKYVPKIEKDAYEAFNTVCHFVLKEYP